MNVPSVDVLEAAYRDGNMTEILLWLPHLRDVQHPFIQFLMASNVLQMEEHVNDPAITLGADPEFILQDEQGEVVLFSSLHTGKFFGLSEAQIGADYGLLEFRPGIHPTSEDLVKEIDRLHGLFAKEHPKLTIMESEAVRYDHKLARVRQALDEKKDINFGVNRGKDASVWSGNREVTLGLETGVSINAYQQACFNQYDDKLLTAGGHLHFGGKYIMMLSFEQLKRFVRLLDEHVLPICASVETKAAALRQQVYGSRGEFRLKPYGIEYRSPSNSIFWRKNMAVLTKVVNTAVDILTHMAFK